MKYNLLSIFLCLLIQVNIYSQVLPEGLVAYYPFNGNAIDESGNGNHGIVYGATLTEDRFGLSDSAYYFDGIDDYIEVDDDNSLDLESLTVSVWIKPTEFKSFTNGIRSYSRYSGPVSKSTDEVGNQSGFSTSSTYESFRFSGKLDINSSTQPSVPYVIDLNEWQFLVYSIDSGTVELYLDGQLMLRDETKKGNLVSNEEPLLIGKNYWFPDIQLLTSYFTGYIDDIMIYNRALSSNEVDELYHTQLDANIPTEGLVAYYPFNGNANDESGNGNHGTVYGATLTEDRCGLSDSAYYFDGNDDYIALPDDFDFPARTISLWFNVFNVTGCHRIYDSDHSNLHYGSTVIDVNKAVNDKCYLRLICGGSEGKSLIDTIELATWYHVVLTIDTSVVEGYINGELLDTAFYNDHHSVDGNGLAILGSSRNTNTYYFNGVIDEVRIYNRTLNSTEVYELYDTQCGIQSMENIEGDYDVCVGEQNVNFSIAELENAVSYTWNYSGSGITISEDDNNISADFSQEATSGNLSVDVELSDGTILTSENYYISVNVLPTAAAAITGDNEVCFGENGVSYSITEIEGATGYIWEYSGEGATITGNSNIATISFSDNATSGYLNVYGFNNCGYGESSSLLINPGLCDEITSNLKIPNCFSPNGDKINDLFVIDGLIENSSFVVFNRFGKVLYESSNYQNNWDGRDLDGNILSSDTYWYVLELPGISTSFTGFIYLKK